MNYFPFHLGDYAAHTGHLEPMEDLAYRRLLDLYYLHEKALPADIAEVARLTRLRKHVGDVELVLREFFLLTDAGWTHFRCDEEISKMRNKLDASDEKDQHEKDRMQRYRERRADMFAALREHGIVPAYDIAMKDLQRLFDENCNASVTPPATDLQRVQAVSGDALATAIPIPTPIPIPIPSIKDKRESVRGSRLPADFEPDFQFAVNEGVSNPREEADKFRDYWSSQAGQKAVKTDWQATWRNWVRSAKKTPAARAEPSEPAWRREQRERTANAVPGIAAKSPFTKQIIDMEVFNVIAA